MKYWLKRPELLILPLERVMETLPECSYSLRESTGQLIFALSELLPAGFISAKVSGRLNLSYKFINLFID